ncbi:MAG: DMT family transporter [Ignavibacteria bacterium]|nr:DMT family transporter [Ignavibacteria bacterium]
MKHLSEHQQGLIAIFFAAILWSSGGLLVKLITLTPLQISFFRSAIAAATFGVIFRKKVLKVNSFTFLNSIFYAAVLIFFVLATKTTTAANAIFLQSTAPIYVLIFEPIINKTKYQKANTVTVVVCLVGMVLFFLGDLKPGEIDGNIYGLLAGIFFASFFLGMRKNGKEYQQSSVFWGNVLVAIICLPFIFTITELSFSDLWRVSFLGMFQIAIAYAIFTYGLKRVFAVEASIIAMIEPVLNPVWVLIGYGEVPAVYAIAGGVIIIAAITIRTVQMGRTLFSRRVK